MEPQRRKIEDAFPDINWVQLNDAIRILNIDLYYGPVAVSDPDIVENYPHYDYLGFMEAIDFVRSTIEGLPKYIFTDWGGFILAGNPEDDPENWDDEENYIGPEEYYATDLKSLILGRELEKYV